MISKIWSSVLVDYKSSESFNNQAYINLRRLNLVIGANNTGKSRLLRKIFLSAEGNLSISNEGLSSSLKNEMAPILKLMPENCNTPQITGKNLHGLTNGDFAPFFAH